MVGVHLIVVGVAVNDCSDRLRIFAVRHGPVKSRFHIPLPVLHNLIRKV